MQLVELQKLLDDYSLHYFVNTSKAVIVDDWRLTTDIDSAITDVTKTYLTNLADLIANSKEFLSDNLMDIRRYISRLIGTTLSLKSMIQLCENMETIFENEINWARALAIRGMITILDSTIQELTVICNQAKSTRFVKRIRDRVCGIIWGKISQMFSILSIMVGIEAGQASPSEIVDVIGKGIVMTQTCW